MRENGAGRDTDCSILGYTLYHSAQGNGRDRAGGRRNRDRQEPMAGIGGSRVRGTISSELTGGG